MGKDDVAMHIVFTDLDPQPIYYSVEAAKGVRITMGKSQTIGTQLSTPYTTTRLVSTIKGLSLIVPDHSQPQKQKR